MMIQLKLFILEIAVLQILIFFLKIKEQKFLYEITKLELVGLIITVLSSICGLNILRVFIQEISLIGISQMYSI